MPSTNLPKHGDSIIEQVRDPLTGSVRYVAKRQFQQFLDDLSNISESEPTDLDDLQNQVAGTDAMVRSDIAKLIKNVTNVANMVAGLADVDSMVRRTMAENTRLRKEVYNQKQLIVDNDAIIQRQQHEINRLQRRLNDLEQLTYGNSD